jgi:hypothetical protein
MVIHIIDINRMTAVEAEYCAPIPEHRDGPKAGELSLERKLHSVSVSLLKLWQNEAAAMIVFQESSIFRRIFDFQAKRPAITKRRAIIPHAITSRAITRRHVR